MTLAVYRYKLNSRRSENLTVKSVSDIKGDKAEVFMVKTFI